MNSPIYDGFATPPGELPLGVPIEHRISVKNIDNRTATRVYESHHSYVNSGRNGVVHHGVYLDDQLVGAITYDYMLASHEIHGVPSDEYIEVARVCIAHDTPNLASCGMAKSQKKFVNEYANEHNIKLLVSYVREDYKGSMFAALKGLGWHHDGHIAKGHQAGNRPHREIREWDKKRWVCEL